MPGGGTKSGDPNIGLVLPVLVALPLVEHLPGVHIVRVVHVAVPGQVHRKVRLEVDLLTSRERAGSCRGTSRYQGSLGCAAPRSDLKSIIFFK